MKKRSEALDSAQEEWREERAKWARDQTERNAARKELLRVLDPFARVVEIQKRLPNPFHDNTLDDTPLRDVLPGSWPTMKDIRALHAFAVAHGWKCK